MYRWREVQASFESGRVESALAERCDVEER